MKSLHHSFDIDIASQYGMAEAVLIHHFQHWIRVNKRRNKNYKEERTWTYQTIEEIAAHFPYLTLEDVRGIIERLVTGKGRRSEKKQKDFEPILIKKNFNRSAFDKTTWYAFKDEDLFVIATDSNNCYEREISQIEEGDLPNGEGRPPRPIPDTIKDTETYLPPLTPPKEEVEETPVSKEEEEEISKRLRERPKGAKPIKSMSLWRKKVLKDIRLQRKDNESLKSKIDKRRLFARGLDGELFQGCTVVACAEHVELNSGNYSCRIGYDAPDKEWEDKFGMQQWWDGQCGRES